MEKIKELLKTLSDDELEYMYDNNIIHVEMEKREKDRYKNACRYKGNTCFINQINDTFEIYRIISLDDDEKYYCCEVIEISNGNFIGIRNSLYTDLLYFEENNFKEIPLDVYNKVISLVFEYENESQNLMVEHQKKIFNFLKENNYGRLFEQLD